MHLLFFSAQRKAQLALVAGCISLGLVLAATATADPIQPISVGPVTIGNGTVTATAGTTGSTTNATVTVNGQPASVDANGNITANIDLAGQSAVTLAITNPATGQTTTTTIPVDLLDPNGVIPASVLDPLRQAAVGVNVPSTGFTSTSGQPVQVSGSVADKSQLASLTVNGIDTLSLLKPDGTFTVPLPATSKNVTVAATDSQGASESSSYRITPLTSSGPSSTGSSTASGSVAAASANGLAIASVRYTTKGVKSSKRVTVTVTVKDKRGLLVRGAKVRLRPASFQHTYVLGSQVTKLTNGSGRTTFTLKLRVAKFNQRRRLFTVATALTPSAKATATTSVRLPKLAAAHRKRTTKK